MLEVVLSRGNADDRIDENTQRVIISIVTLFMWLKFLYFFRLFDSTSYLIRIIVTVIIDMQNFFIVLVSMTIGFGNAFLILSLGNPEGSQFTTGYINSILYVYQMTLGAFDTTAFGDVAPTLVWVLFLLVTVFVMIILLNLLIAIISDSYANVSAAAEQAKYQERASMISENNHLIPDSVKKTYAKESGLILIATDLDKEDVPLGKDIIISEVERNQVLLSEKITSVEGNIESKMTELEETLSQIKELIVKSQEKKKDKDDKKEKKDKEDKKDK